jgi:hypothetical protein
VFWCRARGFRVCPTPGSLISAIATPCICSYPGVRFVLTSVHSGNRYFAGHVLPPLNVSKSLIFLLRVVNGCGVESFVALQRFAVDTADRLVVDVMRVKLQRGSSPSFRYVLFCCVSFLSCLLSMWEATSNIIDSTHDMLCPRACRWEDNLEISLAYSLMSLSWFQYLITLPKVVPLKQPDGYAKFDGM